MSPYIDLGNNPILGPTPLEHPSTTNARQQAQVRDALAVEYLARQKSLNLDIPKTVTIVGVGGVGSWLAYILALSGVRELYLFDHDVVSPSNLNRLPVTPDWVGKNKAEAIRATINHLRPDCDIYALLQWTSEIAQSMKLATLSPWLACTTDTLASRQAAAKWCTHNDIRYIEAAAEGEFGSATGTPAEWSSDLEADPGYASVPVWIGPWLTSAYMAAAYILHGQRIGETQHRMGYDLSNGIQFNTYK